MLLITVKHLYFIQACTIRENNSALHVNNGCLEGSIRSVWTGTILYIISVTEYYFLTMLSYRDTFNLIGQPRLRHWYELLCSTKDIRHGSEFTFRKLCGMTHPSPMSIAITPWNIKYGYKCAPFMSLCAIAYLGIEYVHGLAYFCDNKLCP